MLFGQLTIDKTIDEHTRELAEWASDNQTLIVLDTNILAYLYKLHEAARSEFYQWCNSVSSDKRLAIPAWSATEYLSRVKSQNLDAFTPKTKEPSQIKQSIVNLHEIANLFVDDALLVQKGFSGNRSSYLSGFRSAIDGLEPYIRVFSHQFDPGVIHEEISKHLSEAILDSDIANLCLRASVEGKARFSHRIPPGFEDGHKLENCYGDLIVWYEVLEKASERGEEGLKYSKVLLVSNDEKPDWVYAPNRRSLDTPKSRKIIPNTNPQIKLADPRLTVEFGRKTGHLNFAICNLASLIEGLSKKNPTAFQQLAAAIQINIQETLKESPAEVTSAPELDTLTDTVSSAEELTGSSNVEVTQANPPTETNVPVTGPNLQYSEEALKDSLYDANGENSLDEIIRDLKSHNWYAQNPAIIKLGTIKSENYSESSWFVVGRNIYQAACGNSQKAMGFIDKLESVLSSYPQETSHHILAGILYEIYFDSEGNYRNFAKFSYADNPLRLVTKTSYAPVLDFIVFHLQDHRQSLKFIPGDTNKINLEILAEEIESSEDNLFVRPNYQLISVQLDSVSILAPKVEQEDPWYTISNILSLREITDNVSEYLAIPKWGLNVVTAPTKMVSDPRFKLPNGLTLQPRLALATQII